MVKNARPMSKSSSDQMNSERIVLYAGVGAELTHYDLDVEGAMLVKRGTVRLPARVMYAWPHASGRHLYAASSDWAKSDSDRNVTLAGSKHHITSFRIDPVAGALQLQGDPVSLRHRPIHLTTDIPSEHALVAYNDPSDLTVHRINRDGTVGDEVRQPAPLDAGIYGHQIRVAPSNRMVVLVTRGNDAANGKAEDPGALKVFNYKNGVLTNLASIAPGRGYGFGPRHLDFHPSQPWVFVSLERQNKLDVYILEGDSRVTEPLFRKDTLAEPGAVRPGHRQMAGTLHVHPNGRFVYVANRAFATMEFEGKRVFSGGENDIAVFAIDQVSGEPTLIQNMSTRGVYARTFAIDPSGRMLVAANAIPLMVRNGAELNLVPACLSVFRIGGDGKLDFVRKYDVDVGLGIDSASMFWMGLTKL